MLAIGLLHIGFIMLRYIPSIPNFLKLLSWSGVESYQRLFLHLLRWSNDFCLLLLMCLLHLLICICWTIPESLGWSWLCHFEWSYCYVVRFSLPLFYWGFLLQCVLRRFAYSSPFWRCHCLVLDECNTVFIERVR
jgi:hypothetical protein